MSERIEIVTWVAKDAELRFTPNGRPVLEFRAKVEEQFRSIVYWPRDEEEGAYLASVLKKDARVAIVGSLNDRQYTNSAGETKTALEVKAWELGPMFVTPKAAAR